MTTVAAAVRVAVAAAPRRPSASESVLVEYRCDAGTRTGAAIGRQPHGTSCFKFIRAAHAAQSPPGQIMMIWAGAGCRGARAGALAAKPRTQCAKPPWLGVTRATKIVNAVTSQEKSAFQIYLVVETLINIQCIMSLLECIYCVLQRKINV